MRIIDKNKEEKAKELLDDVKAFLQSEAGVKNTTKFPKLIQSGGVISSRSSESNQEIYKFKQQIFNLEKVKEGLKNSNIPFSYDDLGIEINQSMKIEEGKLDTKINEDKQDTKIQEDKCVLSGNEFKSKVFQVLAESLITPDKIDDSIVEDILKQQESRAEKGEPDAQE
jgi:hypothetical protein